MLSNKRWALISQINRLWGDTSLNELSISVCSAAPSSPPPRPQLFSYSGLFTVHILTLSSHFHCTIILFLIVLDGTVNTFLQLCLSYSLETLRIMLSCDWVSWLKGCAWWIFIQRDLVEVEREKAFRVLLKGHGMSVEIDWKNESDTEEQTDSGCFIT